MSERTKLLKKAVLTGVGASTNVDRIKQAVQEAMDDLLKVGQDLLEDLESKGKNRADSVQTFIRGLKDEASRRTGDLEKQVSSKVHTNLKKAAKEIGLATRNEIDELAERIAALEESLVCSEDEAKKGRARGKKAAQAE